MCGAKSPLSPLLQKENYLPRSGTIDQSIARKKDSIIERCIDINGDRAITHYKVLQEFPSCSKVLFQLETGRTHQIRVHTAHLGHPILGDTLYGHPSEMIKRQALHAYHICFLHPITKKEVSYEAPLPLDMQIF